MYPERIAAVRSSLEFAASTSRARIREVVPDRNRSGLIDALAPPDCAVLFPPVTTSSDDV
eukprot:CAMPEP_0181197604 /NCGR_PEP_ID=MMETSP1096-20121128/16137_1 /TAXON_ID=156174 ORGANISM="Chrysochromulina ericina, Strain CCMP281" /NCGR_SAMPLE_ID=MMETSP1096 /ASSEMBLY_ACC=CAM_ASM_000453 /LENGTH=59 /DNA_ID=CAMNT_0023287541 /DNA_START=730 /DNA_END=910 /DNA_ORIENTATION=-